MDKVILPYRATLSGFLSLWLNTAVVDYHDSNDLATDNYVFVLN